MPGPARPRPAHDAPPPGPLTGTGPFGPFSTYPQAEGVETIEQLSRLRELGCDDFQGFLAARPMPVTEVVPEQHARLGAGTTR